MPLKPVLRGEKYYAFGTVDGKRIRQSLGLSDYALASHECAKLQLRLERERVYGKEAETTFADACIRYIQDHPPPSAKQVIGNLKPIIKEIGDTKLRTISPQMVRSLAIRMMPHCKPQSRNTSVIIPISAVLGHAHQCDMCGPVRIRRFPTRDERIARPIDQEWLRAFMKHAPQRVAAFAFFCYSTASRPQEACNLRPEHLRLDEGIAIGDVTKNGKRRVYVLVPEMVSMLRVLPPQPVTQGPHKGELRVFGYGGKNSITKPWRKACRAAGIEERTKYESGRHSFFTEVVVRHGVDVVTAGKLGNCTPAILLRRYAHADAPAKVAMDVFGTKQTQAKRGKLKTVGKS
jgi:hypothetical protein